MKTILGAACAALTLVLGATAPALSQTIEITDVAGRTVEVPRDPSRIVLGESRMIYAISVVDRDNPFERIVGWKDDLEKYDPDAYRKFLAKFPEITDIANLGSPNDAQYSLEKVISLGTEIVFMNLGELNAARESGITQKLDKAGIPTVFVDFRQRPTQNTVPSLNIYGRIFDERDNADAFVDFYNQQMNRLYAEVETIAEADKPTVFIERAAGYNPNSCCSTFGSANLGRLVELAGGKNWGSSKYPGFGGTVNPEAIFVDDPDIIIGSGANWTETVPDTTAVAFGYEAKPEAVQEQLAALASRPGWGELTAVKNGRFHGIYHQFYNSPFHFEAMQAFAKWMYPDRFADLDPAETFDELHERFLPIDNSGVFWASLETDG